MGFDMQILWKKIENRDRVRHASVAFLAVAVLVAGLGNPLRADDSEPQLLPMLGASADEGAASGETSETGPEDSESASPESSTSKDLDQPEMVESLVAAVSNSQGEALGSDSAPRPEDKYALTSGRAAGEVDQVEMVLEAVGEVKEIVPDEEKEPTKLETKKMEMLAAFEYEERTELFSNSVQSRLRSVRYYDKSMAKWTIGEEETVSTLNEKHQTIVCDSYDDEVTLFSPEGPLTSRELVLIEELPGNSLLIDKLLPNRWVELGETWELSNQALCGLLGLEAIKENHLKAELAKVTDSIALVELSGSVTGAYLGALSEMEIQAKYQFDLQKNRITWLGLVIEENRSNGPIAPGLEILARIQVKIEPEQSPEHLTDAFMEQINTLPNPQNLQLWYNAAKGPWRFSHDRKWYMYQDDPELATLRMLDRGELVAQCKIMAMEPVDVASMDSLETFQSRLKQSLGDSFGQFVAASQRSNSSDYREYRVIIDGEEEDFPLRWVAYLLTDQRGNQAMLFFVLGRDNLPRFDDSDRLIAASFQFVEKEEPSGEE